MQNPSLYWVIIFGMICWSWQYTKAKNGLIQGYFALKALALEVIAYLEKKGNEAIITNSPSYK